MDVGNIAELNTFLVLDAIRSHGRTTRSQVARELGLSDASVSRIVKRLLASGAIAELPGEPAARGRTPSSARSPAPSPSSPSRISRPISPAAPSAAARRLGDHESLVFASSAVAPRWPLVASVIMTTS
jgi:DNA-binding transcriptional MocR family regulator